MQEKEKIKQISNKLLEIFNGCDQEYRFENDLHKYKIITDSVTHWLYISEEFVDDHLSHEILMCIGQKEIVELLKNSKESRRLFISNEGSREVDSHFCAK